MITKFSVLRITATVNRIRLGKVRLIHCMECACVRACARTCVRACVAITDSEKRSICIYIYIYIYIINIYIYIYIYRLG